MATTTAPTGIDTPMFDQTSTTPGGQDETPGVGLSARPNTLPVDAIQLDGRIRDPVPNKLKGTADGKKGNFNVMHMDFKARQAHERSEAAKRTSESTALAAKLAFEAGAYVSHYRRRPVALSSETGIHLTPHLVPPPLPFAAPAPRGRPLLPAEVKQEQARLLSLLRAINPAQVVDQICKAIAFFGGVPEAPPPSDGIFPMSADGNGSGALFVGWITEIFPNLSQGGASQHAWPATVVSASDSAVSVPPASTSPAQGPPTPTPPIPGTTTAILSATAAPISVSPGPEAPPAVNPPPIPEAGPAAFRRRGRGRPKGSKATKVRKDKGIKKGSTKDTGLNAGITGTDDSWVDVDDTVINITGDDNRKHPASASGEPAVPATPPRANGTPTQQAVEGETLGESPGGKKRGRPLGSKNRPKESFILAREAQFAAIRSKQAAEAAAAARRNSAEANPSTSTPNAKKGGRPKGSKNRSRLPDGGQPGDDPGAGVGLAGYTAEAAIGASLRAAVSSPDATSQGNSFLAVNSSGVAPSEMQTQPGEGVHLGTNQRKRRAQADDQTQALDDTVPLNPSPANSAFSYTRGPGSTKEAQHSQQTSSLSSSKRQRRTRTSNAPHSMTQASPTGFGVSLTTSTTASPIISMSDTQSINQYHADNLEAASGEIEEEPTPEQQISEHLQAMAARHQRQSQQQQQQQQHQVTSQTMSPSTSQQGSRPRISSPLVPRQQMQYQQGGRNSQSYFTQPQPSQSAYSAQQQPQISSSQQLSQAGQQVQHQHFTPSSTLSQQYQTRQQQQQQQQYQLQQDQQFGSHQHQHLTRSRAGGMPSNLSNPSSHYGHSPGSHFSTSDTGFNSNNNSNNNSGGLSFTTASSSFGSQRTASSASPSTDPFSTTAGAAHSLALHQSPPFRPHHHHKQLPIGSRSTTHAGMPSNMHGLQGFGDASMFDMSGLDSSAAAAAAGGVSGGARAGHRQGPGAGGGGTGALGAGSSYSYHGGVGRR